MTDDFELSEHLHKLVMDASVRIYPEDSAKRCWIVYRWEVFELMKKAYSEGLKNEK